MKKGIYAARKERTHSPIVYSTIIPSEIINAYKTYADSLEKENKQRSRFLYLKFCNLCEKLSFSHTKTAERIRNENF